MLSWLGRQLLEALFVEAVRPVVDPPIRRVVRASVGALRPWAVVTLWAAVGVGTAVGWQLGTRVAQPWAAVVASALVVGGPGLALLMTLLWRDKRRRARRITASSRAAT